MIRVRGLVRHGRLRVDEPSDLPEGSEVELVSADAGASDEEWPSELDAELVARDQEITDGRFSTAAEVIASLRARQ